jgi:MscS family membrane protein
MNTNVTEEITLGLDKLPWLDWNILGNQVWQYLVFFGYVVAAVFLSKLADVLMRRGFKPSGPNDTTAIAERLFTVLRAPLKLAVFILLLHLGVKPMNKPRWMQDYLSQGFGILIAIAVTYALIKIVDLGFAITRERLRDRDRHGQHPILLLLERAARIFVIGVAILVTADNNGIRIGGVLASLGLTGLAVALAAQETLSNLLGSIVILADSPFFLGDRVKIDAYEGIVEHIGIRSTRMRTPDGNIITLPNRTVAGAAVVNYTKTTEQLASRDQTAHTPVGALN